MAGQAKKTEGAATEAAPSAFEELVERARKLGENTTTVPVPGLGDFHVRAITKAEQKQIAKQTPDGDDAEVEERASLLLLAAAVVEPRLTVKEWAKLFEVTPQPLIDQILKVAIEETGVDVDELAAVEAAAGRFPASRS